VRHWITCHRLSVHYRVNIHTVSYPQDRCGQVNCNCCQVDPDDDTAIHCACKQGYMHYDGRCTRCCNELVFGRLASRIQDATDLIHDLVTLVIQYCNVWEYCERD
jgi:hypothetical protein